LRHQRALACGFSFFQASGQPPSLLVRLQASLPFYLSASPFKTAAILTVVKEHFADHLKPSAFGFYLGFSGSAHFKYINWSNLPLFVFSSASVFSKIAAYPKAYYKAYEKGGLAYKKCAFQQLSLVLIIWTARSSMWA
jgi:hypothetical protein